MKNLSVVLSKQYLNRFYEILSLVITDKKEVTSLRKKVEKYEDVSYLKDIIDENVRVAFANEFNSQKENHINKINELKKALDNFYKTHMEGKEIIDVPTIKKELNKLI